MVSLLFVVVILAIYFQCSVCCIFDARPSRLWLNGAGYGCSLVTVVPPNGNLNSPIFSQPVMTLIDLEWPLNQYCKAGALSCCALYTLSSIVLWYLTLLGDCFCFFRFWNSNGLQIGHRSSVILLERARQMNHFVRITWLSWSCSGVYFAFFTIHLIAWKRTTWWSCG